MKAALPASNTRDKAQKGESILSPRSPETHPWLVAESDDDRGAVFMPSVGEYPIYDDAAYTAMIDDRARMAVLQRGLDLALGSPASRADMTMVELGSGAIAPWARRAADMGVGRVVAVETLPHARDELERSLHSVPSGERVTVCAPEEYRRQVTRADVLVAEVIGTIGSSEGAEATIGGELARLGNVRVVPSGCVTYAAAFSWRRVTHGHTPKFIPRSEPYLSSLAQAFGPVDVRLCIGNAVSRIGLLSDRSPAEICTFDNAEGTVSSVPVRSKISRDGKLDSILFSVELSEGDTVADSMVPGSSWLPLVAPLPGDPIPVKRGMELRISMSRHTGAGGPCPDYRFEVQVDMEDAPTIERVVELPWRSSRSGSTDLHRQLRR